MGGGGLEVRAPGVRGQQPLLRKRASLRLERGLLHRELPRVRGAARVLGHPAQQREGAPEGVAARGALEGARVPVQALGPGLFLVRFSAV